ncbi:MAG: CHASE4 domain-containing protein [Anaerolineae bacterium]
MTLRQKTLALLTATLLLLFLASTGAAWFILARHAVQIEEEHTRGHMQQVLHALQSRLDSLDTIAHDWAAWDDTYAFVQDRNPAYIESNLVDSTFTGLGVNWMLFLDAEGRLVYGKAVDLEEEAEVPLPEGLEDHLKPGSPLLHHPDTEHSLTGLLALPAGPVVVVSRPIVTSNGEGPIRGTFIMGRFLDEAFLEDLAHLVNHPLVAYRPGDPGLPEKAAGALATLAAGPPEGVAVRPLSGATVAAYTLLRDVYGEPILLLEADLPRDLYRQSVRAMELVLASLGIAGLALLGVALYVVEWSVFAPLTRLTEAVERLQEQADLSARLEVAGDDELAHLGRAFNRALDALEEQEARYRDLVERANDGIAVVQEDVLRYVNPRLAEMLGRTVEEMTGTRYALYIAPDELPKVTDRYTRRMRGEPVPAIYETALLHRDGRWVPVELNAGVIMYAGRPADFVFIRDITERRRLEEEQQRVRQLESIGVLAGGIAHDFNNLLTGILGNVSLAKLYVAQQEEVREVLEKAERACFRARDLTQQLLTFARGGAPVRRLTSLVDLVRESAEFVLRGSSVRAEFAIPPDLWAVEADEGQLSQVVQNLVLNARQAMPQGGVVRVACANVVLDSPSPLPLPAGRYVRISVQDTGIGNPQEHLPRIFDPYFTTKQEGHGLGLATAFSIVRRHGGHITVESELGKGSRFDVYLPASEKPAPRREDTREPLRGQGRVLVMDDGEMVRGALRAMLESLGYEVALARDGAEALEQYRAARDAGRPFHAVVLDLTVPGGMGGKEAAQELLRLDPEARLIVSSGYSNDPVLSEHTRYGFRGVLPKPFRLDDLARVLREVLVGAAESSPRNL